MLHWLSANLGTIAVALILAAVVALVVRSLVRKKKAGSSCCGGCSGCPMNGKCH